MTVRDARSSSTHDVTVSGDDATRLAAATDVGDVERLLYETFDFLLEREPKDRSSRRSTYRSSAATSPNTSTRSRAGSRRNWPQSRPRPSRGGSGAGQTGVARIIAAHVRAVRGQGGRTVPDRRTVAIHGTAGALRAGGFGWGAAWTRGDGRLCSHRDLRASGKTRRVPAASAGRRRPPSSSTFGGRRGSRPAIADAQPFDDPAGRYAFSLPGDLREWRDARVRYQRAGRIHGRADTEVGARWLEDRWDGEQPATLLKALHDEFHGQANLAVLTADGTPVHYAGNTDNPVFTFRLGRIGLASTGLYSLDRSLFGFAAPGATARRLVRQGDAVRLERNGDPLRAS